MGVGKRNKQKINDEQINQLILEMKCFSILSVMGWERKSEGIYANKIFG